MVKKKSIYTFIFVLNWPNKILFIITKLIGISNSKILYIFYKVEEIQIYLANFVPKILVVFTSYFRKSVATSFVFFFSEKYDKNTFYELIYSLYNAFL